MQLDHAVIVAKREYLARVRTRGFWIASAVLPLFMVAMVYGPSLAASHARSSQHLAILDTTGSGLGQTLAAALAPHDEAAPPAPGRGAGAAAGATFFVDNVAPATSPAELDSDLRAKKYDGWIWLSPEAVRHGLVEYHAENVSNVLTQSLIEARVSGVVSRWRLRQAGLTAQQSAEVSRPTALQSVRISDAGSHAEKGGGGFMLAFLLCFVLYIVILLYGTQVMQGVLEEKSSRVVEVIASAIRPTELMAGKLVGICLVALTQLTVWLGIARLMSLPAAHSFLPPTAGMSLPSVAPVVIVHLFILFLLGFVLFSTLYAMIGASFNSVQEAQQFAGIAVVFIVPPLLLIVPIINDPDSTLAVSMSFFPFFTPLVMMLRIASKMPPAWQIAAAYALCLATIAGMVWLCARVYRVGILMYGKKPTLGEIARWVRTS
jgi:ABC-2 type transport system permease protein